MAKRAVKLLLAVATIACLAIVLLKGMRTVAPLLEPEKPKRTEPYRIEYTAELVPRDLNNLVETSNLIAVVRVVDGPRSLCVRRAGGSATILSEQTAVVERVFMGDADTETVTVRQTGGTVGLRTDVYTENPVLQAGSRYLLFLYRPDMGGGYNTEGDYYYIRGVSQGAYTVPGDGTFRPLKWYGTAVTEAELTDAVADRSGELYSSRAEYLAAQKRNYKNGVITKEHYEENLAQVDEYAVIIPETEAPWH